MKRLIILIALMTSVGMAAMAQKTHVVQRGETLETIANSYNITIEALQQANNMISTVYAGKKLTIPVGQQPTNSVAAAPSTPSAAAATPSGANGSSASAASGQSVAALYQGTGALSDKERYRRSSLCLIMLTHRGKKYAEDMERVFKSFPLPARYNEHNIADLRVISVSGKQSQTDIEKLLKTHSVGQKVVSRWFNRTSWDGMMNMDLIHQRGGYGAMYGDYLRSRSNIRGAAMLRDEGIELLQSTFVLVCDMEYIDRSKGSAVFGGILGALAAATSAYGDIQQQRGNYETANQLHATGALGSVASAVVSDIGGFRVKMNAYLFRLKWDDVLTQRMYNEMWVDANTPSSEADSRKKRFDNNAESFQLEFVGKYSESSSKTILRSWKNEDEVILDVCHRCVTKGMRELARNFVIFRPRSPFYFDGSVMYSHIGTKEDVTYGKKYEVIEPYKDKRGQICYRHVGKAEAGIPWDNMEVSFDQYFDPQWKGTMFNNVRGSTDLHAPGLQLREM